MMVDLINEMNRILRQWQDTYDILHNTRLNFTIEANSMVFLNEIAVPDFRALHLETATFNAEHIMFHFVPSRTLHIALSWPEEGIPTVSSVDFFEYGSQRRSGVF